MTIKGDAASDGGQRVLLTGGRAPAVLDLARQLAACEHEVFVAESCPEHLCKGAKGVRRSYEVPEPSAGPKAYVDALQRIIQSERIDWLLPTCEELFYVAHGLEQLSAYCRVFVEPLDKLRRLHSKWEFIGMARKLGFAVPQTYLLTTRDEGLEFLRTVAQQEQGAIRGGRWVFKPVFSRFSSKVIITETAGRKALCPELIDRLGITGAAPWVAQQYISGHAYCSYSVVHHGRITAHAVYPVRFTAGQGACISFEAVRHPDIDRWVERFVQAECFTGQIAFDFIEDAAGELFPIECNPRATSGIHLFRPEDRLDTALFAERESGQGQELGQGLPPVMPEPSRKAMISVAMWSYGLFGIRSWQQLRQWGQFIAHGRDVVYDARDRRPFWQQFRLLYWNWRRAARQRISIMDASTQDIEWNGGELR